MKQLFYYLFISLFFISLAEGQLKVRLQGGAAIPTGSFDEVVDVGFGANFNISMPVFAANYEVSLSTGYYYCGLKDNLPDYKFDFQTIPVLLGFRINLNDYDFIPYLGVEAGLYFHEYYLEVDYGLFGIIKTTTQQTNFGISPELGFKMNLSPALDLDVNAKYNHIKTEYYGRTFLVVQTGFAYRF